MKKNRDKKKERAEENLRWRGPEDGPWPSAFVDGQLEFAEPEWMITNDLGTYAMSTLALMHTRRQHGLLVTDLKGDFQRYVVLSHLEMTLEVGGRTHQLSTHQFPNVAPTLGYRSLESFTQDPLPRWVYRFPSGTVERTVSLVQGKRCVVISLTWTGKKQAKLTLRPLMPMRPSGELCVEHGGMLQTVLLRAGEVVVQPKGELPEVKFLHSGGVFMGSPDWWRKFEYLDDRGRYVDFQEDMWSPGSFEMTLESRQSATLVVGVGDVPDTPPAELVLAEAQRRLELDPGPEVAPEVRSLWIAAESFVLDDGDAIVAGYPWLDAWSRDAVLSLRGLFLARGQIQRAKRCFGRLVSHMRDGLLPQRTSVDQRGWTPCLDASLWLFAVGEQLLQEDPEDEKLRHLVEETLEAVFRRMIDPDKDVVWLTEDGLLENGADVPLTWMDAQIDGSMYTPRQGLAVEIQALWVQACDILARMAERRGKNDLAEQARAARLRAETGFGERFWCHESNYPFDCMSAHMDNANAWADPSVRPNALIALAVAPSLFEPWQRAEVLSHVEEFLLTPLGVRSLEPRSLHYVGHAGGTIEERRAASHQGTVWPHLLLYYVRAACAEGRSHEELYQRVRDALRGGRALGYVAQNADGDSPHRRRGSPAYALATGMLLEALVYDLQIGRQGRVLW